MTTWKYLKGTAEDFEGAPEWAMRRTVVKGKEYFLPERTEVGKPFYDIAESQEREIIFFPNCETLIAQRERVTSVNDDRLAHDMVNHPSHYTQGGIECIDAIKAATVGKNGIEAVCVANVIKYLWRYEEKNGVQDCHKARWYLGRLIKELYEGD